MQEVIRYHLDQHVHGSIARGLRLRGIEVTTTAEANLQDASDNEHLAFALKEGRVLFTRDDDFPAMHHQGVEHAGMVYSKQGKRTIGEIIRFLEFLSQCLEPKDMYGRIEYF